MFRKFHFRNFHSPFKSPLVFEKHKLFWQKYSGIFIFKIFTPHSKVHWISKKHKLFWQKCSGIFIFEIFSPRAKLHWFNMSACSSSPAWTCVSRTMWYTHLHIIHMPSAEELLNNNKEFLQVSAASGALVDGRGWSYPRLVKIPRMVPKWFPDGH